MNELNRFVNIRLSDYLGHKFEPREELVWVVVG